MKFILAFILLFSIQGCNSNQSNNELSKSVKDPVAANSLTADQQLHIVSVLEVIQVENYTYLKVKEGTAEMWIAAPSIVTKPQDILYYERGMMMTDFESKELKRKFDKILFVDKISKDQKELLSNKNLAAIHESVKDSITKYTDASTKTNAPNLPAKQALKIEPPKSGVSIASILKNPKTYEGKTIVVKGKITKYTAGVMGKNWVHIQDGTDYNGKFEIVITTLAELKDGETATFEGMITLNKDLGYGYFFEVLMEDAKIIK